ncbi:MULTISPECIES: M20 aminoacylase family protein [unclassified Modicisalibacter]|uniref:M20 aminoacylase family protein n=1 Tax=unclassified Modicisalibacter TaxID=2679913 RepID=UPI001CCF96AC|nr:MULTISPECIES: M20 aminoacylase family protein [unclassified Modicisalibacter]MBZ9559686.1 amidohydrolase [Modicisalibacter sp. R2A 31.J]MBZ9577138.1 amidohydrolase [Modicisalibacter sp. MOD 31.J]
MTDFIDPTFFDHHHAALTRLRHDLHRHPELGFQEHATAERVAAELTRLNIPFESGIGGTGIVATVTGQLPDNGRRIGLRADMDALPIQELGEHQHASTNPGVMHACGHDGHTTMLLGVATYLAAHREFAGTLYLVFQPAEEGLGGGRAMVEDGLFERFPMDAIYALHNWPALPAGRVAVRSGAIMAATDRLDITVRGKGGHGGVNPHLAVDPVRTTGALIQALHSVVSRDADPLAPAALSLCGLQGGDLDGFAIIPDEVRLSGTVRTLDTATQDRIEQAVRRICDGIAAAHGSEIAVDYQRIFPATLNDAEATRHVEASVADLLGEQALVRDVQPSLGGEDFSFMLQRCPGAYFFLGTAEDDDTPPLHNARFDFNDNVIPVGCRLLAAIGLGALRQG